MEKQYAVAGQENGNSWIIIDSVDVTNCSANAVRSSYGGAIYG